MRGDKQERRIFAVTAEKFNFAQTLKVFVTKNRVQVSFHRPVLPGMSPAPEFG